MHRHRNARTKAGKECRAPAVTPDGRCIAHSETPELRDRLQEGRVRGGRGKATRERLAKGLPNDLRELKQKLLEAFESVRTGSMDARTASALSTLATAIVRVSEHGRAAATLDAVEQMLQALEEGDYQAFTAAAEQVGRAG